MITEAEINKRAFEFVERLYIRTSSTNSNTPPPKLWGTRGERGVVNLASKLKSEGIATRAFGDEFPTAILHIENGTEMGLEGSAYGDFRNLITDILAADGVRNATSYGFAEGCTFQWLINIKRTGAASQNLMECIKQILDNEVEELEFFFPVINLDIAQPFRLGNVDFTFFTKDYMNKMGEYYKTISNPLTDEEFNVVFRKDYQAITLVNVRVKAESQRAKEIALQKAERAVDCLKIAALSSLFTNERHSFDLNHRLNFQTRTTFLSRSPSSKFGYAISLNFAECHSFECTNDFLSQAKGNGLESFATFITVNKDDELYNLIIDGIQTLAFILSIADRHMRIVSLISFFEGLLLEDGFVKKMEETTKRRIIKLVPGPEEARQRIIDVFTRVYAIRHQMTHKGKRFHINHEDLTRVQMGAALVLIGLMDLNLNEGIIDKAGVIKRLDEPWNNNNIVES